MKYSVKLTEKSLYTDYENIDGATGQERYSLASMATNSNDSATEKAVLVLVSLISNVVGCLLYAGIVYTLHPLIVLFVVASAGINLFLGKRVNRYVESNKDALADVRRKLDYIGKTGGDFKAAKDLRLYGTEKWFDDNYKTYLKKRINIEYKNDLRRWFHNLVDGGMVAIRDVLTYGLLTVAVLEKGLSIGDFALYFGAVVGISGWLSGIVKDLTSFDMMSVETQHLREYLEMPDHHNRARGGQVSDVSMLPDAPTLPYDIELVDVSFRYPGAEKDTVTGLNLHIKKGEKLALVGVNGAGKTTIVKLICGLYRPTHGEIKINGISTSNYNIFEYYKLFSVVFQDHFVLPMTIEENIALKNKSEMSELDVQKVNHIIDQVGLRAKIERLPEGAQSRLVISVYDDAVELSGGEYQKLMLAQALYKSAPIMILDEPTAALDPIAENEIYQQYNQLTERSTSIFISHRLSSTRFCDRILFLEDGAIVEFGTHAELMRDETRYKHMYDKQSHYYKEAGEISA
jgi:ABC-type multidrug transport system fused ATPase/permease subunit